LIVKGKFND